MAELVEFYRNNGKYGRSTFARKAPTVVFGLIMTADEAEFIIIPNGAEIALFSSTANFFALPDATPTPVVVPVTDGTSPELNPTSWDVSETSNIGLITEVDSTITISFYK